MASLNKVLLIGHLGRDPEIRSLQDGSKVCNLSLATSETWKDRNTGERKEKTEWHRVVVFSERLVDVAEKYLKKGSQIYLEGKLQTRKWTDQSGNDKFSTEIVLQKFGGELVMLDKREGLHPSTVAAGGAPVGPSKEPDPDPLDDDIPF